MVTNLKGSLKEAFNATGIGFDDDEIKAEARNVFGTWAVDLGAEIANQISIEQNQDLTQGAAGVHETLHVNQRDRNELVNEKIQKDLTLFAEKQDEKHRAFEIKKHNLSLDPDRLEEAGLIKTSNAANKGYKSDIEKQRKERQFNDLLIRLQEQRRMWENRLHWLENRYLQQAKEKEQLAKNLRQTIADNIERMQENSTFISEIDKMIKAHKNGEHVDKEKLRQLLKERGVEMNETTTLPALLYKAENLMKTADEENAVLEQNNDVYEQEADNFEEQAKKDKAKAAEIHQQLEDLKEQNLSAEEFNKRAEEIWEDVPLEVKRRYENTYGDEKANNEVEEKFTEKQKEVAEKQKHGENFDPMAMAGIKGEAEPLENETQGIQPPTPPKPGM